MATTKSSVDVYKDEGIIVKGEGTATLTADVSAATVGTFDVSSSTKNWSIGGASLGVSVVASGSGNDIVDVTGSVSGASINVGTGRDSLVFGNDVINTAIVGGEGSKTVNIAGKLDPSYVSIVGSGDNAINIGTSAEVSTIVTGAGRDTVTIGTSLSGSKVNTGAGDDSVYIAGTGAAFAVDSANIDLGAGRDTLNIGGPVTDSSIIGGDGVDAVSITGATTRTQISLGAGKDTIKVGGLLTDVSLYAGADADVVSLNGGASYSYVDLGDGADSIILRGAFSDTSITAGAGKDTIDAVTNAATGTVSIVDYNVTEDVVVSGGALTVASLASNGNVTVGAGVVNVSKTGEFYAVQTKVGTAASTYTAWGDDDGSTINISEWNKNATIYGNVNGDAADLILGGKKVDNITLGANDSVYGGAGDDSIAFGAGTTNTQEYIGLASAGGKDTVAAGFQDITAAVSKDEADVLYLFENNISSLKLEASGANLVAKVGNGSVQLNSIGNDDRINVKDNSGKTYEVEYVDGLDSVTSATDELADFYYASGTAAQLDFSSISDTLVVDLGNRGLNVNDTSLANTDGAFYYGNFASVTGGADKTVLLGAADAKETLTAGAGDTTLWGGGKKADVLQHGAGTANTVTFFFGDGDGADTITSSNWGNSDSSDVLWLGTSSVKSVKNDGTSATTITLSDGSKATLSGFTATDTAIKVSFDGNTTMQAKVGKSGASNTWTYDENVTAYLGGSKNTLNVGSSVDEANIWLDGSQGKVFDSVTTVNASSNSGTVILAGGAGNETLVAGTGSSSLWGGSAGNDVLAGNSVGNTTFYFGNGNGNDVISASNTDDKVVLYNTALSDVKAVDDSKSGVLKITLNDGSSLTVNNTATSVNTFQLGDGSTWKYDASKKSWSQG